MKKCYIIGAGRLFVEPSPDPSDLVIAADGGYAHLEKIGVRCDLAVGDYDSLGYQPSGVDSVRLPVEKDYTDTHVAYLEGVKRGYTDFYIYGGSGGQDDHTFANISLLLFAKNRGHSMTLIGECADARVIKNETVTLRGEYGKRLSVFAIGSLAKGVTIKGARYELLSPATLSPDFALGVSNSFLAGDVTVSVEDGALLIYTER